LTAEEVPAISGWLVEEGAQEYTQRTADRLTSDALDALQQAASGSDAALALRELADRLLKRKH
jgi:geranylgeranyl pyrophosphate synthase